MKSSPVLALMQKKMFGKRREPVHFSGHENLPVIIQEGDWLWVFSDGWF
jgi:hypothetical protein